MKRISVKKITRRTFLGLSVLAVDAFAIEPAWLEVTNHDIEIVNLPEELDGYKIAQITDTHIRSFDSVHRAAIKAVINAKPDLIALTGDMIEGPEGLPSLLPFLNELSKADASMVAILGNWEHWSGVTTTKIADMYQQAGVKLLVNESMIAPGGIIIAATDDGIGGRPDFIKTFAAIPKNSRPKIFMTHSPYLLDKPPIKPQKFDLCLAGHTHGGQGRIGSFTPFLPPGSGRFVDGFYKTPYGKAYVSRGVGTSIFPARFLCRPEVAIFTLRNKTGNASFPGARNYSTKK